MVFLQSYMIMPDGHSLETENKKICQISGLKWSKVSGLALNLHYTCQLSRLRRESHACGLKTSISRLLTPADQFLTPDWKMWVVAVLLDTISKNMLIQTHVRNENHV